ncbi:hypothetical protein ACFL6K_00115 [Candidatus Latescibacterota bacterium]
MGMSKVMNILSKILRYERWLWLVLSLILIALIVFLNSQAVKHKNFIDILNAKYEDLEEKQTVEENNLIINLIGDNIRITGENKLIIDYLVKHPELIPFPGVLGGKMRFVPNSKYDIRVLTPQWIYAIFEDGHIRGHMLLEYNISNGNDITMKSIDAYLE